MQNGAAMWVFQQFMKDPSKEASAHRVSAAKEGDAEQEGKLTTYFQIVNYLLSIYVNDDFSTAYKTEISRFKQQERISEVRSSKLLCGKTLSCGRVYNELLLNRVFFEGLREPPRFSMRTYKGVQENVSVQSIVWYETSLSRLQENTKYGSTSSNNHRDTTGPQKTYSL